MTIRERIDRQIRMIEPIFEKAQRAHEVHHEEWEKGVKAYGGYQAYKKTDIFNKTLEDYYDAQNQIEGLIQPIIEKLKAGNSEDIDKAFAYLEIKKRHFRSGYMKGDICRAIKKIELNDQEKSILEDIILQQIDLAGQEFKEFARLVPKVRSKEFQNKLVKYDAELSQDSRTSAKIRYRVRQIKSFLK